MRFRTTILQGDKTATGIRIPDEIVEALGAGKRPPITVTINGFTYRSTVAVMGGAYMVGVSAENCAGAGVAGGDEVDVDIELDTAPREVACRRTSPTPSTPNPPRGARSTACRTATRAGTSTRSRAPRPTRRGNAASASRSRHFARAAFAEDVENASPAPTY